MRPLRGVVLPLVAVALLIPSSAAAQDSSSLSPGLMDFIDAIAQDVMGRSQAEPAVTADDILFPVTSSWGRLVLATVADALGADVFADDRLRTLDAQRQIRQTARVDRQVTAAATGAGTVSLVDKAGIPEFFALALENGAVTQEQNGTTVTLRSGPYALIKAFAGDSAETFTEYDFWRRFGLSASFALDSERAITADDLNTDQLTTWSLRARIVGDRSTRSARFTTEWETRVLPGITASLQAFSRALSDFYDVATDVSLRSQALEEVDGEPSAGVQAILDGADPSADKIKAYLASLLTNEFADPVRDRVLLRVPDTREQVRTVIAPAFAAARVAIQQAKAETTRVFDEFNGQPLLTLQYGQHKTDASVTEMMDPDAMPEMPAMAEMPATNGGEGEGAEAEMISTAYSEIRAAYEQKIDGAEVVVNGFASFYDDAKVTADGARFRGAGFSFSVEATPTNGLTNNGGDANDLSPIQISGSAEFSWFNDLNEMLVRQQGENTSRIVLQAQIGLPIAKGLSLPMSVTTDKLPDRPVGMEWDTRFYIGTTFDFDVLRALSQVAGQ